MYNFRIISFIVRYPVIEVFHEIPKNAINMSGEKVWVSQKNYVIILKKTCGGFLEAFLGNDYRTLISSLKITRYKACHSSPSQY